MTVRVTLIAALLLLCAPMFAKPPAKVKLEWRTTEYESGKIHEKYTVQVSEGGGEKRWGEYTAWYETGKKSVEGEYEDGKRQGRWEWFHENGEKQESGFYEAGVEWNEWTKWHPNGKKASEGKYANGKLHEKWGWWWENGKKKEEQYYDLG
ncbi:MAG: hypothetical protein KDB29_14470, partial [Planctomycetes bacterium]|nr:hypothetical protein [Planctomycetota bacterium]